MRMMFGLPVCHVHDLVGQKKGLDSLELTLWMVLSYYVGPGN